MQDIQVAIELGVDLMKDIVAAGYSFLEKKNKERDFFGAATRRYIKNLLDDYGSVRVLGMEDEVPLDSLYVRVNIIEKITSRSGILPEEMEQDRERYFSAFGRAVETVDGEEIVNREQKFIVLGKPGAGKTTYLKYITLRMISKDKKSSIQQRKLPIFVTLREWADKKMPLLNFIVRQFDLCGFEEARPFVERMLTNGDCLVLLDGLDEVSRDTRLDDIIQQVIDFTREYRDCQFIASCRVAAYNHWFEKFKDVEIADFNEQQIEQFVRNFFQKEPKTTEECWEKLKNNQPLKELASVPLLLTLLCITYNARQDFERNKALLYAKAIDTLINRWDADRRIKRDKLYKALDEANMVNMLARIAAGYFEQNIYFFREEDLHRQIGNFLQDIIGPEAKDKGKVVLHDIESHYGILVRRSEYAYSFAHLTFLEYFTAQYIVDNALKGSINLLVDNHFCDDRWLEIFLLTAGKLGSGAEEYLLLMQRKNRQLLKETPELDKLLWGAQEAILQKESEYSLVFREMVAVFVIYLNANIDTDTDPTDICDHLVDTYVTLNPNITFFSVWGEDIGYSRRIDEIDSAHSVNINFDTDKDGGFGLAFATLKSYSKTSQLTTKTTKIIEQFLKGNAWIVKCLNSGAFVSAPVREKILHDLLKPRREGSDSA